MARRIYSYTFFDLVPGAIAEDRAIEILTHGAKDFLLKAQRQLEPAVRRVLNEVSAFYEEGIL